MWGDTSGLDAGALRELHEGHVQRDEQEVGQHDPLHALGRSELLVSDVLNLSAHTIAHGGGVLHSFGLELTKLLPPDVTIKIS